MRVTLWCKDEDGDILGTTKVDLLYRDGRGYPTESVEFTVIRDGVPRRLEAYMNELDLTIPLRFTPRKKMYRGETTRVTFKDGCMLASKAVSDDNGYTDTVQPKKWFWI